MRDFLTAAQRSTTLLMRGSFRASTASSATSSGVPFAAATLRHPRADVNVVSQRVQRHHAWRSASGDGARSNS
jgi:hypothetical protein